MNNEQLANGSDASNIQLPTSNFQSPTSNFQIKITRPDNGTIYHLTPQTPIDTQRIPVQVIAADGVHVARVTILVDGEMIGEFTAVPVRTFWTLRLGSHTITVTAIDDQGNRLEGEPIHIEVTQ